VDGFADTSMGFGTPRLVRVAKDRMELRARGGHGRSLVALGAGVALSASGIAGSVFESPVRVVLLAILCATTLFALLKRDAHGAEERHVFDLRQGRCFKGPDHAPQEIIPLPAIRALHVEDSNDSHRLSLLLHDGKRAALGGYARHDLAIADAGVLSQLLCVPIRVECEQSG